MPGMESTEEMFDLRMSEGARPLFDQVKTFIEKEVQPITLEFFQLGEDRKDRWSWVPGQLELLDGVKAKAKYHHGDLREALLAASYELVAQQGAENFLLADACRRAGVSTAAPYKHFRDRDEILEIRDLEKELSRLILDRVNSFLECDTWRQETLDASLEVASGELQLHVEEALEPLGIQVQTFELAADLSTDISSSQRGLS